MTERERSDAEHRAEVDGILIRDRLHLLEIRELPDSVILAYVDGYLNGCRLMRRASVGFDMGSLDPVLVELDRRIDALQASGPPPLVATSQLVATPPSTLSRWRYALRSVFRSVIR